MRMGLGIVALALGLFTSGSAVAQQQCDTFQECMAGMCQNGQCVGEPLNSGPCDDFNDCTTNDSCLAGVCRGTPRSGSCEDLLGECTVDDTCMVFGDDVVCLGTTPAEPGTPCAGGCGTCQEGVPLCQLTDGQLNQACTLPQNLQDLGKCFVGKCTLQVGLFAQCFPSQKVCPDDDNLCTGEFCNSETGDCDTAPLPARLDCFPAECHRCLPDTGQCVPNNVGASCEDGNSCTTSTVCASDGSCILGAPPPTATPTHTRTQTPTPTATTGQGSPTSTVAVKTATPTRTQGTPQPTATLGRCVGDCDDSGQVKVNELVTGVNIALDRAEFSTCSSFDINDNDRVEVNELVSGVNSLLRGCVRAAALR